MTDSLLSQNESKVNRLDPPHDLTLANNERVVEASAPWMSLAGRDPATKGDQLDRQTSELLSYVQQQNDEIDARQAELNAKLARLDNELRAARLTTGLDNGTDLLASAGKGATEESSTDATTEVTTEKSSGMAAASEVTPSQDSLTSGSGIVLDEVTAGESTNVATDAPPSASAAEDAVSVQRNVDSTFQEFEEVERLVAQFTGSSDDSNSEVPADSGMVAETQIVEPQVAETQIVETQIVETQVIDTLDNSHSQPERIADSGMYLREDSAHVERRDVPANEPAPTEIREQLEASPSISDDRTETNPSTDISEPQPAVTENVERPASTNVPASNVTGSWTEKPFPALLGDAKLGSRDLAADDIQAMASSLEASEMESERRLLAERKVELDRRKETLQRMQDETQALHREALEMRLVTEQLWIEISGKAPTANVESLMETLKSRLNEQYESHQKTIDQRKAEMQGLQELVEQKQANVREQSVKLQQWVESRHDEIKSYAAEVDAREALLDRREHRMAEEFSKWEAQRSAYQSQLQSLLSKLNLQGIGE